MTEEAFRRPSRLERTLEKKRAERKARRRFLGVLTLVLLFLLFLVGAIGMVTYRIEESTGYFSRRFPDFREYLPTFLADCFQMMDKTPGFR
ncbi:MAG: hypothetical protein VB085_11735 [Peptococcaceae bacterium]|nr:hypothetical protein [Peptococcaceae bacterium]